MDIGWIKVDQITFVSGYCRMLLTLILLWSRKHGKKLLSIQKIFTRWMADLQSVISSISFIQFFLPERNRPSSLRTKQHTQTFNITVTIVIGYHWPHQVELLWELLDKVGPSNYCSKRTMINFRARHLRVKSSGVERNNTQCRSIRILHKEYSKLSKYDKVGVMEVRDIDCRYHCIISTWYHVSPV